MIKVYRKCRKLALDCRYLNLLSRILPTSLTVRGLFASICFMRAVSGKKTVSESDWTAHDPKLPTTRNCPRPETAHDPRQGLALFGTTSILINKHKSRGCYRGGCTVVHYPLSSVWIRNSTLLYLHLYNLHNARSVPVEFCCRALCECPEQEACRNK